MKIVVFGYVVRGPFGGMAWHHLQYVMGLQRLGHDVYFFEDSDEYESCYDSQQGRMTKDASFGLRFAATAFEGLGFRDRWAYFDAWRDAWVGPMAARALEVLSSADLLLNVSGVNPLRAWSLQVPRRALIDTDPLFTQVRHLTDSARMRSALSHTVFFTFGENVTGEGCSIPNDSLRWIPTRQPIVLDAWPVTPGNPEANFTTVMHWNSYPAVSYKGQSYGMKSASFHEYFDVPCAVGERMELVVAGSTTPRDRLLAHGWQLTDPEDVASDPFSYQRFLARSKAEFSVAKHGYVCSRSGWFSDRSAAYLASGRPVVTQNTGFTDWLQADAGVLPFDTYDSAIDAIRRVSSDYARHCRLAREIAAEYFDSGRVLDALLERALGL